MFKVIAATAAREKGLRHVVLTKRGENIKETSWEVSKGREEVK